MALNYKKMFTLRKDGRYMGYVRDENGKRVPKYHRDPEVLYRIITEYNNPQAPLFRDVAEAWKEDYWIKASGNTKKGYVSPFNRAVKEFGDKRINEIDASDIYNHLLAMAAKGYAYRTVAIQRVIYKSIFNYAIVSEDKKISGWIKINPASEVSVPSGLPQEEREPPEDSVYDIIDKFVDAPFGLFPFVGMYTGMRRGEIAALCWEDIDFKNKRIICNKSIDFSGSKGKIKAPKTKSGTRIIPMLDVLYDKLLTVPHKKGLIFVDENGNMLNKYAYDRMWKKWCITAGLTKTVYKKHKDGNSYFNEKLQVPTLGMHQLRHGFATLLFEAGTDVYSAKDFLGHSKIDTTLKIYTHLRNKQREKSIEQLNQYLKQSAYEK